MPKTRVQRSRRTRFAWWSKKWLNATVSTPIRQAITSAVVAFFVVWGLEGFHELDPVAVATIILAAATFYMARYTAEQVEMTRLEINASQRPVIVPTVLSGYGGKQGPGGRGALNRIVVPVKNLGRGPAINIDVYCEGDDFIGSIAENHAALGAGEEAQVLFPNNGGSDVHPFAITIVYDDLGGQSYKTTAQWDTGVAGGALYTEMKMEGPLLGRPAGGAGTSAQRHLMKALRSKPKPTGPTEWVATDAPVIEQVEAMEAAQSTEGEAEQTDPKVEDQEEGKPPG